RSPSPRPPTPSHFPYTTLFRSDVMLIPMVLAQRAKAWTYATICTVGSVIGGMAGYAIGYYLFEFIGEPILKLYGYGQKYEDGLRSEEHTSELQSRGHLVCRLLL